VKVLLDENLDHRLRNHLGAREVFTASYQGWDGFKNGKLLQAAEDDGFEVLVTGDQTLQYEQNLTGRRLAIVSLSSVEWRIIKDHLPQIIAAIDNAAFGSFQAVDCGTFSRKPPTNNNSPTVSQRVSFATRQVQAVPFSVAAPPSSSQRGVRRGQRRLPRRALLSIGVSIPSGAVRRRTWTVAR
jgi:hypothetical protein